MNPAGRSDCAHKHTLVASSYCGLCHIKLCTSIFTRGAIWQPAYGRHKGTAAHFSDAKKMQTQAKFRPCGSFFSICAFPPSVMIMRVCAAISRAGGSLPEPVGDAPNGQHQESSALSNAALRRCEVWKQWGRVSKEDAIRKSSVSVSHQTGSASPCGRLWKAGPAHPYIQSHTATANTRASFPDDSSRFRNWLSFR